MTKLILLIAAQIFLLAAASSSGEGGDFARTMDKRHLGLHKKKEVLTHLRLYWHDSLTGPKPSAAKIHEAVSNSSAFGTMILMDDPLTIEESNNSTVVGQAQGIYALASQEDFSNMMVMNLAFKTGKYNGSTIAILGRNLGSDKVRELPVVGGSGIFRFARGYIEFRTKFVDYNLSLATLQYDCYVLHYE